MSTWADGTSTGRTAATLEGYLRRGVNVKEYGAVGNGSTDDTSAINAAIDAAAGNAVFFPSGTYKVTSALTVTDSGTALVAYPGTATINASTIVSGSVVSVSNASDCLVYGLTVTTDSTSSAIVGSGCDRMRVVDCVVTACWKGVTLTNGDDTVVDGCHVTVTTSTGSVGHGILVAKSGATTISGFRVTNNRVVVQNQDYGHGIWWYGGAADTPGSPAVFYGVVSGNHVSGGFGGIWGTLAQWVTITNNIVDDFYDVGIDLEQCWDVAVSGNTLRRCRGGALTSLYGGARISFTGNTVWNDRTTKDLGAGALPTSSHRFVFLRNDVTDVQVVGNTFVSTGASVTGEVTMFMSASSTGASRVRVADNQFVNGCLYAIGGQSELAVEDNAWYHNFSPEESTVYIRKSSGVLVRGNDMWMSTDMVGSGDGYSAIYVDQQNASSTPRCENILIERNRIRNRPDTGIAVNTYNGTDAKTYVVRDNLVDNVYYRTTSDPASAVRSNNLSPTDNSAATVTGF